MTSGEIDPATLAYLRSPRAIRDRCGQLFTLACENQLQYFRCDLTRLDAVADYVIQVTRNHYPDLHVPFHSRWRHFEVGRTPRLTQFNHAIAPLSALEQAKAKFDLVILSVLLDAGAGPDWQYRDGQTGEVFQRSEGLAIASLDVFCQGLFSGNLEMPYQATGDRLQTLTEEEFSTGFQVRSDNPLIGVAGRVKLVQRLGQVLYQHPDLFGANHPRPGNLVDYLLKQSQQKKLLARTVLTAVLEGLSDIWAGRIMLGGINLGDVWKHSALPNYDATSQLVPFHKLSQWLTYSLLEPLMELGLDITDLDELTGLPEYRNGGLCLDLGLLQVKDNRIYQHAHLPGSEVIVEWRSLTVILLDQIAQAMRQTLHLDSHQLPLAKVLQGGTWTAGRRIAAQLRPNGTPPLVLESDGTVF